MVERSGAALADDDAFIDDEGLAPEERASAGGSDGEVNEHSEAEELDDEFEKMFSSKVKPPPPPPPLAQCVGWVRACVHACRSACQACVCTSSHASY